MNFFNRAIKSITRKKVRTVVLLLIIVVLSFLTSASIIVNNSVKKLSKDVNSNLSKTVTVEVDYEQLDKDEAYDNYKEISIDQINKIGESKYIDYYDYSAYGSLMSEFKAIPYGDETSADGGVTFDIADMGDYMMLMGTNLTEITPIRDNEAKLASGSLFTEEDITNGAQKVLIYEEFAELNNLSVGDTFKASSVIYNYSDKLYEMTESSAISGEVVASQDYDIEVAGILEFTGKRYEYKEQDGKFEYDEDTYKYYDYISTLNTIYTTNGFISTINKFQSEQYALLYGEEHNISEYYLPMFVLKDSEDINNFINENENNLPKYSKFVSDLSKNEAIMEPLYKMNNLFTYVLIISCVTSIVILSLLVTLFLRERQKEIGIYLSLGINRVKVIGQIVTETLLIALVAITLSLPFAYMASDSISTSILSQNIEEKNDDYFYMPSESTITTDYIEQNYSVSLSFTTVLLIYLMFIVTVLLASIIPGIYIVNLSPKKIML